MLNYLLINPYFAGLGERQSNSFEKIWLKIWQFFLHILISI